AERDERHAVVGVALAEAEEALAETEGKDEHAHTEELGHEEMTRLVHEDENSEDDDEPDQITGKEGCGWHVQRLIATSIPRASLRAQPSQLNASSTEWMAVTEPECRSSTRSTISTIPVKGSSPSRKRCTAISFAALRT